MTGSLRVLSRNCLRGLALNGPLGAAMELEGGRSVPSADPSIGAGPGWPAESTSLCPIARYAALAEAAYRYCLVGQTCDGSW